MQPQAGGPGEFMTRQRTTKQVIRGRCVSVCLYFSHYIFWAYQTALLLDVALTQKELFPACTGVKGRATGVTGSAVQSPCYENTKILFFPLKWKQEVVTVGAGQINITYIYILFSCTSCFLSVLITSLLMGVDRRSHKQGFNPPP